MATQKISEMTEAIILQDEDYVPIVQSELNKKIKIEYLRDYNKLHNKPTLNGVTIENNKKLSDYNIIKANQGIKVNSNTNQTLELEVPSSAEMEARSAVNKAITIATADKMAKETAHQTMSKEYTPNSQALLTQGENQPVSYKAVKDYVDTLEVKVDTNESDIESKVSALGTEIDTLETKVDTNETDIENKFSTLQQTVNNNKTELDQDIENLNSKITKNQEDIANLQEQTSDIDDNILTIEEDISLLKEKDEELVQNMNSGYAIANGNLYSGSASDYGIEIGKASGNYEQVTTNGYQLFDASKLATKSQGGATVTNNGDGSFTISGSGNLTGTFSNSYTYTREEALKLIKAGTLYSVAEIVSNPYYIFGIYNKSDGTSVGIVSNSNNKTGSATIVENYISKINDGICELRIYFYGISGKAITSGTIRPMVYQDGDGTWEPFTGGEPAPNLSYPQEPKFFEPTKFVSHSKNLLDNDNIVNYFDRNYGTYNGYKVKDLKPNTKYTMSTNVPKSEIATLYFGGIITGINGVFANEPKTISTNKNGEIDFYIRTDNSSGYKLDDFVNGKYYIQLEEGEVATSYAKYYGKSAIPTNITLRALPNGVCDTYENGVITRRVGVLKITRATPMGGSDFTTTNRISYIPNDRLYPISISTNVITNTHQVTNIAGDFNKCNQQIDNGAIHLYFKSGTFSDINEYYDWLDDNEVGIYYELAEPTTEYCSFPAIPSYFNYTNAWHDSEVEASDLIWKAKTYNALLEQEKFIEADYIKVTETNDMISTPSNRGGAELLEIDGAYEQVTTNGYQLFDASKIATKTQNNITVTNNNDGSFTVNGSGTASAQTIFGTHTISNLKKGTLYIKSNDYVCPYLCVDIYWGSVWKKVATNAGSLLTTIEITQEDINNSAEARVYLKTNSSQTINPGVIKPMIYQDGDGAWEPFTGGEPGPNPNYAQEPKFFEPKNVYSVGKNLFNPQEQRKSRSDTTAQIDGDDINVAGLWYMDWKVKVEPNTDYTISFDCNGKYRQLAIFDKTGNYNFINNLILQDNRFLQGHNSKTFNTNDNELIYVLLYASNGSQGTTTYSNVMINKGTSEQPYTPFVGSSTTPLNLTLRALPNGVKDTYENSVITRRVEEITFDGSSDESFTVSDDVSSGFHRFGIAVNNYLPSSSSINVICDRFKVERYGGDGWSSYSYNVLIIPDVDKYFRFIVSDDITGGTLEGFKSWLQSNPIKVWYQLATPTTEGIDKPFIETYYPWTNIWTDSPINTHMKIGFKNRFGEFYTKKEVDELIKEAIAKIGTQMIK